MRRHRRWETKGHRKAGRGRAIEEKKKDLEIEVNEEMGGVGHIRERGLGKTVGRT